jgi:CRP-like cAMP-binding protein
MLGLKGTQNRLLAALPDGIYGRLREHLEDVTLAAGEVVYEAWVPVAYAYFPHDAIVSLGHALRDGRTVSIAMIGNEGMLGSGLLLGGSASPYRALVQNTGRASRIKVDPMRAQFARGGPLEYMVLRYTQALLAQVAQTAVCNRHHSVEQQLCRWLLMTADRSSGDTLTSTHELISTLLGVRREGITEAAYRLQEARLIQYNRGRIALRNRNGLERRACECYRVVRQELDRLLPAPERADSKVRRLDFGKPRGE